MSVHPFIHRWQSSAAAERANYQLFLSELCDCLEVPRPDPAVGDNRRDRYVFERPVTFRHPNGLSSAGFIDLYKRGCFVLEAKQGTPVPDGALLFDTSRRRGAGIRGTSGWDEAMLRARNQAEQYAKALPIEDGWLPFHPDRPGSGNGRRGNSARPSRPPALAVLAPQTRPRRPRLLNSAAPARPETVAGNFTRALLPEVKAILDTLAALGQATRQDDGYRS